MVEETRREIIRNVRRYLKHNPDVVAIAGSGLSGIPLVAILCHITGLVPVYVRPKGVECHDTREEKDVCGGLLNRKHDERRGGRYIIVDDLIDSGTTVDRIMDQLELVHMFDNSEPKAILLYRRHARGHDSSYEGPIYYVGCESYWRRKHGFRVPKPKKACGELCRASDGEVCLICGKGGTSHP
jgi:hypoxanthine phosphoribosyltransferase